MIDRMSIMNPTLQLYAMRAQAGFTVQRPAIVVESVSNYVRLAAGLVRARVIDADVLRKNARSLGDMLGEAAKLKGADAPRIAEVRAEIAALVPSS